MVDINSVFSVPLETIPTNKLAWGGWFSDYLLRWLPTGLAANILCFGAIVLALGIISQKNSFELMKSNLGNAKLSGATFLFCIAMYSTLLTKSTVFLYFNF